MRNRLITEAEFTERKSYEFYEKDDDLVDKISLLTETYTDKMDKHFALQNNREIDSIDSIQYYDIADSSDIQFCILLLIDEITDCIHDQALVNSTQLCPSERLKLIGQSIISIEPEFSKGITLNIVIDADRLPLPICHALFKIKTKYKKTVSLGYKNILLKGVFNYRTSSPLYPCELLKMEQAYINNQELLQKHLGSIHMEFTALNRIDYTNIPVWKGADKGFKLTFTKPNTELTLEYLFLVLTDIRAAEGSNNLGYSVEMNTFEVDEFIVKPEYIEQHELFESFLVSHEVRMLQSIGCSFNPEPILLRTVVDAVRGFTEQEIFVDFEEKRALCEV
jgi:hypothetical protein